MVNEKFYVGVNESGNIRKNLLGCSKDVIGILRHYDDLHAIRTEKVENIMNLKDIVREIRRLNARLKEKLPTEAIRIKKVKAKARKNPVKKIGKETTTQMKKLEDELEEIETRLSSMGK